MLPRRCEKAMGTYDSEPDLEITSCQVMPCQNWGLREEFAR